MSCKLQHVTVELLRGELTAAELAALPSAVVEGGEPTDTQVEAWLQERVLQACDRVVAALNTCSRNLPIQSGLCKVPAACVRTVLVLARHAAISAIPGLAEVLEGSSRSAEYSTAVQELRALASCELVPEYALADGEGAEGGCVGIAARYGEKLSDWMF